MPVASSHEPAKKKARLSLTELSEVWARDLIAAPMPHLESAADVRGFLEGPLPGPIIVDAGRLALHSASATPLPGGGPVLPLEARDGERVMFQLETLIDSGFSYPANCTTEETVARLADELTGRVWRLLSQLVGTFSFEDSSNSTDRSGATKRTLRPDYCAWINDALVFKAEHKADRGELDEAMDELVRKMTGGWNPVAMRGLPFLPAFAVGGEFIQFAVVFPGPGAAASVESISEPITMMTPVGRLRIMHIAFNLFRVMAWLRRLISPGSLRLYTKLRRGDRGEYVIVNDDHVEKRAFATAPADLYELLAAASIPCAVRVDPFARVDGVLSKLIVRPVGIARLPRSDDELRSALDCVLRALEGLHSRGFVHRDVRWPNLMFNGSAGWFLLDFEGAGRVSEPVPPGLIRSGLLSPEARIAGAAYELSDDVWQVGNLLSTCKLQLSPTAEAFRMKLMAPRDQRPNAAAARHLLW